MVTLDVRLKKVNKVYKEGVRKRFYPDPGLKKIFQQPKKHIWQAAS